jgi:hypothetical protein
MLTNPALFDTVSEADNGFSIPEMEYNPAGELRGAADLPPEASEATALTVEEEVPEGAFTAVLVETISERMMLQHQQLYFAFALCVLAFQLCGKYILLVLRAILRQVMNVVTGTYSCIRKTFLFITSCIKRSVNVVTNKVKGGLNHAFDKVGVDVELEILDSEKEEEAKRTKEKALMNEALKGVLSRKIEKGAKEDEDRSSSPLPGLTGKSPPGATDTGALGPVNLQNGQLFPEKKAAGGLGLLQKIKAGLKSRVKAKE